MLNYDLCGSQLTYGTFCDFLHKSGTPINGDLFFVMSRSILIKLDESVYGVVRYNHTDLHGRNKEIYTIWGMEVKVDECCPDNTIVIGTSSGTLIGRLFNIGFSSFQVSTMNTKARLEVDTYFKDTYGIFYTQSDFSEGPGLRRYGYSGMLKQDTSSATPLPKRRIKKSNL